MANDDAGLSMKLIWVGLAKSLWIDSEQMFHGLLWILLIRGPLHETIPIYFS
jgi:hypothetical protein